MNRADKNSVRSMWYDKKELASIRRKGFRAAEDRGSEGQACGGAYGMNIIEQNRDAAISCELVLMEVKGIKV